MKIFPPKIEIGEEEGFSHEKDIFSLAKFGDGLTTLVEKVSDQIVLALDGPWGSGKSTFVKMWAGHLRTKSFPVIYFDAFENDYVDDAFLALAGEVIALSNKLKNDKTEKHKKFLKSASKAGRMVIKSAAKIAVKGATLGALDASDLGLGKVAGDIEKAITTGSDAYIERLLSEAAAGKNAVAEFKQSMSDLVPLLSKGEGKKPLIFILDELDRCKPVFALELMEKIKHVFSVPNVHFVLVTNLSQMEHAVKYAYGQETDARLYLHKFYNLVLHLPMDGQHEHESAIRRYTDYLMKVLPQHHKNAVTYVGMAARAKSYPLRTIERAVTYIALATIFTTSKRVEFYCPPQILAGLALAKAVNPVVFQKAKVDQMSLDEINDIAGTEKWEKGNYKTSFETYWAYATGRAMSDEARQQIERSMGRFSITRETVQSTVANGVMDRLEVPPE